MDPHDEGPGRQIADRIAEKRREVAFLNQEIDLWEMLWAKGDYERLKELRVIYSVPVCEHPFKAIWTEGGRSTCDACGELVET